MQLFILLSMLNALSICAQTTARVVRVKDGDTYVLATGGNTFTARLMKIDAPEMSQKSGVAAFRFVNSKIVGKTIQYAGNAKDKYGRTLVSITIDGQRLDSLIIRSGWAWHYENYDNETLLENAMQEAISDSLGLWACGISNVCPPWLYRGYNAKNRIRYCKGCSN